MEKILYFKLLFERKIHRIGQFLVVSYLLRMSQEKFLFYCDLLEASSHPVLCFISFLSSLYLDKCTCIPCSSTRYIRGENKKKRKKKRKKKKGKKCYTFCVEVFSTLRPICFYMFSLFKKLKLFHLTSFRRRNRHSQATKNILSNNLLKENLIQPNGKLFRRI